MSKYLIIVEGAAEPSLKGPFESDRERVDTAKVIYCALNESNMDNIFGLDIDSAGVPNIWAFMSGTLGDDE